MKLQTLSVDAEKKLFKFSIFGNFYFIKPDSTQIVGRLMQIRDYIKQATSMMDGLKRSTDPVRKTLLHYKLNRRCILVQKYVFRKGHFDWNY